MPRILISKHDLQAKIELIRCELQKNSAELKEQKNKFEEFMKKYNHEMDHLINKTITCMKKMDSLYGEVKRLKKKQIPK